MLRYHCEAHRRNLLIYTLAYNTSILKQPVGTHSSLGSRKKKPITRQVSLSQRRLQKTLPLPSSEHLVPNPDLAWLCETTFLRGRPTVGTQIYILMFAIDALDDPPGGTAPLFSLGAGGCEGGEEEDNGDGLHLVEGGVGDEGGIIGSNSGSCLE